MLYGVDVHPVYQAGLNIPLLKQQGYTFVAIKATQGTSYYANGPTPSDPGFAEWVGEVRKAGMIPGAYHWLVKGSGAAQCDWFLKALARVGGHEGLLIQLDCEDNATFDDVKAWAARWKAATGGHPFLIYTGRWWWDAPGRKWDGSTVTPYLWDSHYLMSDSDGKPDNPADVAGGIRATWWAAGYGGWKTATILQFTSKGDAGGLSNNVDLNATKMSMADLLALTGKEEEEMGQYLPRYGDEAKGSELKEGVKSLQRDLVRLGYVTGTASNMYDGIYGDRLAAVVKKFRAKYLDPGEVGEGKVVTGWMRSQMNWELNVLAAKQNIVPGPPGKDGAPGSPGAPGEPGKDGVPQPGQTFTVTAV